MKEKIIISWILVVILISLFYYFQFKRTKVIPTITPVVTNTTTPITDHAGMKLYQNKEFGFEFWYPENWKIEENSWGSPFSKFNMAVQPPNVLEMFEPFSINVTTADYALKQFPESEKFGQVYISDVSGKKYEFMADNIIPESSIILIKNNFTFIISINKNYENIANQIISTFKFTK